MASNTDRIFQPDGVDACRMRSNLNHSQSKQEYYNTVVSPLTKNEHYILPWPIAWLFEATRLNKINKLWKGEVISTVICLASIFVSFSSSESLYNVVIFLKTVTTILLPPLISANVFFWTSRALTRYQLAYSFGHIMLFCAIQELYCELFVFLPEKTRYILGLVLFLSASAYIVYTHHGQGIASVGIISTLAVIRFVIYGLFKAAIPSLRCMHLVTYAGCLIGLHLGELASAHPKGHFFITDNMEPKLTVVRRRRESSVDSTMSSHSTFSVSARQRRTSLPVLGLPPRRVSMSSMDLTTLGEAHGMITDMLADPSLPPYVIGTLRVIGDMISPLLQHGFQRAQFSSPLVTVMEKNVSQVQDDEAKVIDQPDLKDDTPLSLKQRLSRQLGVNVRRMSSSYTTTTSATGMPTLDHEYRFRNSTYSVSESMPSRSPSPKVSQRAKSYAGIFSSIEPRREFMKSRSFCQTTSPLVRQDGESLGSDLDLKDSDDGIFKAEVASGGESFFESNDTMTKLNDSRDTLEDNQIEHNIDENSDKEDCIRLDRRLSNGTSSLQERHDDAVLDGLEMRRRSDGVYREDIRSTDPENREFGNERSHSVGAGSKISPLAQRRTENLTVAQVAPVRKNSRDESARRLSRDTYLSVPRRTSTTGTAPRLTSRDIHHEIEVSCREDISNILNRIYDWEFPVFELAEQSNVLTQLALRIFQVSGFFRKFNIPQDAFLHYFRSLEQGYHEIPYHNKVHAADVLHGVYYLTNQKIPGFAGPAMEMGASSRLDSVAQDPSAYGNYDEDSDYGCLSGLIPELELMALYTAAAMHDFDHPGRTNAFLVATLNPKALLYNDHSVLENHHAAASWSLLVSDQTNNFLSGLDSLEFKRFRFTVIEEILSTDLKKHFDFLSEWNAKTSDQSGGINWAIEADRLLVGQMCMKLADISGPSKTWDLHYKWTERIVEEFYLQGDEELCRGMPISAYMDRSQPRVAQLQESFIKHLVGPLYNAFCRAGLLPGEWVEVDATDDEDDDTESGASPSIATDSNSDRSDTEDDTLLKPDGNGLKCRKVKKRIPSYPIIINLERNHEAWQEQIRRELLNREASELGDDEEAHAGDGHSSKHHNTIAEEDEMNQGNDTSNSSS